MSQKLSPLLTDIVTSAKKRGYITQDEILGIYSKPEDHIEELDSLYDESRQLRAVLKASYDTARANSVRQNTIKSAGAKQISKSSNPEILKS